MSAPANAHDLQLQGPGYGGKPEHHPTAGHLQSVYEDIPHVYRIFWRGKWHVHKIQLVDRLGRQYRDQKAIHPDRPNGPIRFG